MRIQNYIPINKITHVGDFVCPSPEARLYYSDAIIVQTVRKCVRILRTFASEEEESSIVARVQVIKRNE